MVLFVSVSNEKLQINANFKFVKSVDLKFRRAFFVYCHYIIMNETPYAYLVEM